MHFPRAQLSAREVGFRLGEEEGLRGSKRKEERGKMKEEQVYAL